MLVILTPIVLMVVGISGLLLENLSNKLQSCNQLILPGLVSYVVFSFIFSLFISTGRGRHLRGICFLFSNYIKQISGWANFTP